MKTVFEHIEYVKGQPHHIRKGVAFTVAAAVSGLIGLVWIIASLATGSFAVQGSSFADATGAGGVEAVVSDNGSQGLAGAATAPALQGADARARIEIVDTTSSTRPTKKAEQTTIPF